MEIAVIREEEKMGEKDTILRTCYFTDFVTYSVQKREGKEIGIRFLLRFRFKNSIQVFSEKFPTRTCISCQFQVDWHKLGTYLQELDFQNAREILRKVNKLGFILKIE